MDADLSRLQMLVAASNATVVPHAHMRGDARSRTRHPRSLAPSCLVAKLFWARECRPVLPNGGTSTARHAAIARHAAHWAPPMGKLGDA